MQSKLTTLMQSADDLAYTQQWQRQDYGTQKSSEMERTTQVTRIYTYSFIFQKNAHVMSYTKFYFTAVGYSIILQTNILMMCSF